MQEEKNKESQESPVCKESQENQQKENSAEHALQTCQKESAEWKDRCLRITAEFENFKKRQIKERQQWEQIAQTMVLKDLLPVILF